jgi:HK97 family phage major capsid protein
MKEDQIKEMFRTELKSVVDESIAENIKEIAGKEVSDQVKSIVAKMRLERSLYGQDSSGLSDEVKLAFAQDLKALVSGKLASGVTKAAILENADEAGGYLVPDELYQGIMRVAASAGIVARDAMKFPMSSDSLDVPRYTGSDLTGEYVGEDSDGSETSVTFGDAKLLAKTWMVILRVGNTLIADAKVGIVDWLIGLVAEGLAVRMDKEGFKGGTFAGSPFVGILGSTDVTVFTLPTGHDTFAEFDMDDASDMIANLPESLLADAAFYFNRTVWAKIRQKKDTAGAYVMGSNMGMIATNVKKEGIQPAGSLWGFPVYTSDQLPANSATAVSTKFCVFGNLGKGLFVGEKGTLEVAQSDSASVGSNNVFTKNQRAIRFIHRHAINVGLPSAIVVGKTAAS